MKARVAALTVLALLASGALARSAAADTAPVLSCGTTITTQCSETEHFSDLDEWDTPLGATDGCPAYLGTDYAHIVGSGNGIEHDNINKAGDFWATNTFTGSVTITFYDPSKVDVIYDEQGNIVSATPTGPADDVVTGHMTQWFGVSDNKQSLVFDLTFSFVGADESGNPVTLHGEQHQSWTPGSIPFVDPPSNAHMKISC